MGVKSSSQVSLVDITDAYSVILTSEAYTFTGDKEGAPIGLSCSTEVVAYCGTTPCPQVSITQSKIICPPGITATVTNNNTLSPEITFKTTAVIKDSCEAIIPVEVDGVTINKKFSFSVAKQGADGSDNIQVGGRNLLLDTRLMGPKAWYTNRYELISSNISNDGVVTVPAGSANFSLHLIDCKPNEEYVFSVDAKSKTTPLENAWCAIVAYYEITADGKLNRISFDKLVVDLTTDWQRFSKPFKVPDNPKISKISIGFRAYIDRGSSTPDPLSEDINARLPKLERGNTPSDWSPAPEDSEFQIGGRNLLLETGIGRNIIGTGEAEKASEIYLYSDYGKTVLHNGSSEDISISFDWKTEDAVSGFIEVQAGYSNWNSFARTVITESNKSGHVKHTGIIPSTWLESKNVGMRFRAVNVTGTVEFSNLKLELGNVPSDWSPAPEDVETDIDELRKEYKSELKIEQDRITANVEATDALGSRVSKVEQTADGLEVSLSNLKFGGRNLLIGTGDLFGPHLTYDGSGSDKIGSYVEQSDGSILITNNNTNFRVFPNNPVSVVPNTYYTISIDYKFVSGSHPFQFQIEEYDENKISIRNSVINSDMYTSVPIGDGWNRIVGVHKTIDDSRLKTLRPWFRTGLDFKVYTCKYYIRRPKMEIGNVATDWSPAPEDILDAPKTATNFLSYDSTNGLQVGNKTSGSWTGTRARIKPSAFEIIDSAGAILASYGANRIDLGKNSQNTVIGLCGGKGTMSYSASNGGFSIESTDITIRSTNTFNILNGGAQLRVDDTSMLRVGDTSTGQYSFVTMGKDYITLRTYKNNGTGSTLELKQDGTIKASVVGDGFNINGYGPLLGNYIHGYYGMMRPDRNHADWIRTTQQGIIPYQNGGASALGTSSWPFSNIFANNIYDNGTLLEDKFVVNRGFYTNVNNFDNIYTPGVWGINGLNIRLTMYNSLLDGSSVTYTWNVWGNLYVAPHFSYQMLMCNDPRNGRPNILIRHKLGNPAAWSYWVSLGN